MITLKQWMDVTNYRVTEGGAFGWQCYGANAYSLDSWDGRHEDGHSFTVIFDTQTQVVYEVQAHDYLRQRAYRMINPEFREAYDAELEGKEAWMSQAWDDVDYVDLDVDRDWLEKAQAIVAGEDYDTRVQMQVEFSDEELLKYMMLAHEQDVTFNAFIEQALREAIKSRLIEESI